MGYGGRQTSKARISLSTKKRLSTKPAIYKGKKSEEHKRQGKRGSKERKTTTPKGKPIVVAYNPSKVPDNQLVTSEQNEPKTGLVERWITGHISLKN